MEEKILNLKQQLRSPDEDEVYNALIKIGKGFHKELKEEIIPFLHHSNIELRSGAIRVLGFYWRLPEYKEVAWEIYKNDKDNWVRAGALMTWIGYSENSADKDVLKTLFQILNDNNENEYVRQEAYRGIFVVSKLQPAEWPKTLVDNLDEDVNWELVNKIVND